ncbi:MAG: hypothetical protein ISS01_03130 [Nanoarchaeota archaeon]|nr:hypothetical protein [Nanoarchaeota archaeon]
MQKRGQFTLFVILGIALILILGMVYYYKDTLLDTVGLSSSISYPSEIQEIYDHIQDCTEFATENAVSNIALTGGYYEISRNSIYIEELGYDLPYYYNDGEDLSISEEQLQKELNIYTEELFTSCVFLEDYSNFEITEDEISISSIINNNTVELELNYPLIIESGENIYYLTDSYNTEIDANLGWLHSIAQEIVYYDQENPEELDLNYLLSLGLNKVTYIPYDNETFVYILEDTTSFNGEQNYTYIFASYFPTDEETAGLSFEEYWESLL